MCSGGVCATEDRTAIVVVASYRSVSRNPVRFKALVQALCTAVCGGGGGGGGFALQYCLQFYMRTLHDAVKIFGLTLLALFYVWCGPAGCSH